MSIIVRDKDLWRIAEIDAITFNKILNESSGHGKFEPYSFVSGESGICWKVERSFSVGNGIIRLHFLPGYTIYQ